MDILDRLFIQTEYQYIIIDDNLYTVEENLLFKDNLYTIEENLLFNYNLYTIEENLLFNDNPYNIEDNYEENLLLKDIPKGFTKKQISFLTSISYGKKIKEKECSICIDTFKTRNKVRKLDCGHVFHKKCIDSWFDKAKTCPLCRCEVKINTSKTYS